MTSLRPIERRVLALTDQGLDPADIARRFKRGEAHVERILRWTAIPREGGTESQAGFRPIERRIIDMRAKGMSYEEIGSRFRRSAGYVRRIEDLARLRSDLGLAQP